MSRLSYRSINEFIHSGDEKGFMVVSSIYGVVTVPISNSFLIRSGVGFNQQAYSYTYFNSYYGTSTLMAIDDVVKCKLSYVEIPLSVSYKLPFGQRKFEIFAGGSFGFNLGGHAEIDQKANVTNFGNSGVGQHGEYHYNVDIHPGDIPTDYNYIEERDYKKGIYANKYNISFLVGSAYHIHRKIILGLEAQLGLSNVFPHDYRSIFGSGTQDDDRRKGNVKTKSYMLTVTYLFGSVKK